MLSTCSGLSGWLLLGPLAIEANLLTRRISNRIIKCTYKDALFHDMLKIEEGLQWVSYIAR